MSKSFSDLAERMSPESRKRAEIKAANLSDTDAEQSAGGGHIILDGQGVAAPTSPAVTRILKSTRKTRADINTLKFWNELGIFKP